MDGAPKSYHISVIFHLDLRPWEYC